MSDLYLSSLDQPLGKPFLAHSLRSGIVTYAGKQKISMDEAIAMTGRKYRAIDVRKACWPAYHCHYDHRA